MKIRLFSDRGFTLLEVLLVLTIVSMLTVLTIAGSKMIGDKLQDNSAQQAAALVVGAQQAFFETYGSYASADTEISQLTNGVTVVAGDTPSTGPSVVSTSASDTSDIAAAAVLSESGSCFVWRAEPRTSSVDDVRLGFDKNQFDTCTAEFALTATGGDKW